MHGAKCCPSDKRISDIAKSISRGKVNVVEHSNKGRKRPSAKTEDATVWMHRYFHLVGDHMPHNNRITPS